MDMIYWVHQTRTIFSGGGLTVIQSTEFKPPHDKVATLSVILAHNSEMPYSSIGETVDGQSLDSRLRGDFCLEECDEQDGCYTEVYVSTGDARFDC